MKQQQDFPVFDSKNYKGLKQSHNKTQHDANKIQHVEETHIYKKDENNKIDNKIIEEAHLKKSYLQSYEVTNKNLKSPKSPSGITKTSSRISDEIIKGQSRIQFVPYEKKTVDYVDQPKKILKENRKVQTDYHDHVVIEYVPRQVLVTDYYAVEHIRCYVPQIKTESAIQYVPIQRKNCKREYIPVQRQIVHYPIHSHDDEAPRYLGVRQKQDKNTYENVTKDMYQFWQRQYEYKKDEPIESLNLKIRLKYEQEKKQYFEHISDYYTQKNSQIIEQHYIKHGQLNKESIDDKKPQNLSHRT